MSIAETTVQEIKTRAEDSIASIIGDYVQLKNQGSNMVGLCPFHHEKTPSFSVNQDRKMFYCFGCHKGGGIITFIMEIEKLTYPEALEHLAKRLGIRVVYTGRGEENRGRDTWMNDLAELQGRLAMSLHHILLTNAEALAVREYIKERGIEEETITKFKLGYAPKDSRWMYAFLSQKGYTEDFLAKSGLFSKNHAQFPLFAGRLMFPINDRQGRTVAFGGRILPGTPQRDGWEAPKYINSPASDLYKKRETLYALDAAQAEIKRSKEVYLAEGYMDVIALHQAGIVNAVAPLGTSFTDEQAKLLRRWAEKVYLIFDTDAAGREAASKAILTCRKNSLSCAVVDFSGLENSGSRSGGSATLSSLDSAPLEAPAEAPEEIPKDPADILKKYGQDVLKKSVKCYINDFEYLMNRSRILFDLSDAKGKSRGVASMFPYLEALDSEIEKEGAAEILADFFAVSPQAIKRDFAARQKEPDRDRELKTETDLALRMTDELFLLIAVLVNHDLYPRLRAELRVEDIESPAAREIFIALEDWFRNDSPGMDDLLGRIENEKLREFVVEKSGSGAYSQNPEKIIKDGISRIKQKRLENRRKEIIFELRTGKDQRNGRIADLLSEKVHIDAELCRIKEDSQ